MQITIIFIDLPGYSWVSVFHVCSTQLYNEKGEHNGFIKKHEC